MSGSRTVIFGASITPVYLTSMNGAGSFTEIYREKPDAHATIPQNRAPLSFKQKLIAEVKKHDIIWQDLKQKKNKDLVDDAWLKVHKALGIKKPGFCEAHWKRLVQGYCNYVRRSTPIEENSVAEMAFLDPQIKKWSSDNQSNPGAMKVDPSKIEKPKKVVNRHSTVRKRESVCEAQEESLAILTLLFQQAPRPEMKLEMRKSLVESLINMLPEMDAKISKHGKEYLQRSGNVNDIDWSALDIPAEVCKAVWDYKILQRILKD